MTDAIKHYIGKEIKNKRRLTGGYTFDTWMITLSDDQKVVFRSKKDFYTSGGRKIVIADVLERERFFYDTVNQKIGHICPEVYAVDGTYEYHDAAFCIMEYIEGTPLNIYFDNAGVEKRNRILYHIGEIAAQINTLKIDGNHPYVINREPWSDYMADRLYERLLPLENNDVIKRNEIVAITESMREEKASTTNAFLHLDMRRINMIYNNGSIFLLDAENCEFGDPLWELAVIDVGGEIEPILIDEYKKTYGKSIDLTSNLYEYYKLERIALVLNLFINLCDKTMTQYYLDRFLQSKARLMR